MLNPLPSVKFGWKWLDQILNRIIMGANSSRPIIGSGLTFTETPNGVIVSLIRSKDTPNFQQQPPQPTKKWLTIPLKITLEGQQTIISGGTTVAPDGQGGFVVTGGPTGQPSPDTSNPANYYPFALPSGSYQVTFLDNVFQPIGTDGWISVSGGSVSAMTVTSVPNLAGGIDTTGWSWAQIWALIDYLNSHNITVSGGTIWSFNWELTLNVSPLSSIPGDVEFGRYYFTLPDPPAGAVYGVVGKPGNNIYGQRAINLGQFTINDSSELGTGEQSSSCRDRSGRLLAYVDRPAFGSEAGYRFIVSSGDHRF